MNEGVIVQNRLRELVAEEVRALLARRRLNGAKLAAAIDRSEMYVSRRLRGETSFDLDDLEKIADKLDVQVADLLPKTDGAATRRYATLTESASVGQVSSPRSKRSRRQPERARTRPAGTSPKAATRRPVMFPRSVFA